VEALALIPGGDKLPVAGEDLEGTGDRSFGMILIGKGNAKDRQDAVTDILVHRSLMLKDHLGHHGEIVAEKLSHLARLKPFRKKGEPLDIRKKEGALHPPGGRRRSGESWLSLRMSSTT